VFNAMVESRAGLVHISDVDPDIFQAFLWFRYSGQLAQPPSALSSAWLRTSRPTWSRRWLPTARQPLQVGQTSDCSIAHQHPSTAGFTRTKSRPGKVPSSTRRTPSGSERIKFFATK
jgi:hypothetical protein